jgi:hypothetical protein
VECVCRSANVERRQLAAQNIVPQSSLKLAHSQINTLQEKKKKYKKVVPTAAEKLATVAAMQGSQELADLERK